MAKMKKEWKIKMVRNKGRDGKKWKIRRKGIKGKDEKEWKTKMKRNQRNKRSQITPLKGNKLLFSFDENCLCPHPISYKRYGK